MILTCKVFNTSVRNMKNPYGKYVVSKKTVNNSVPEPLGHQQNIQTWNKVILFDTVLSYLCRNTRFFIV